jgi:hypothetical protein
VINSEGHLVELDGMTAAPKLIQKDCSDLLRGAVAEIKSRLEAGKITESLAMMTLNAM